MYAYEHSLRFNSFGHFLLSMLQNFLGQVVSLTNLYLSLETNVQQNNTYAVHYEAARIARIMTIFEPIELIDDDLIYNGGDTGGTGDADELPDPDANSEVIPSRLNSDTSSSDGKIDPD